MFYMFGILISRNDKAEWLLTNWKGNFTVSSQVKY